MANIIISLWTARPGDRCDWTFDVVAGSTKVGELLTSGDIIGESEICADFSTTYSTTGVVGGTIYEWTVNGIPQTNSGQSIDLVFPNDGLYELCVTASNVCDTGPPTCETILVRTPETLELDINLCEGESFEVAGETLTDAGDYEFHITTFNGCDSAIFVNVEVFQPVTQLIDINLCNGEEFFVGNNAYSQTGVYQNTLLTSEECDSIVTLDLFIIECEITGSTDFTPPICHGDANGILTFTIDNGTPPFNYDWSNITNPSIGGTGTTNLFNNNEITGVPAGIYEINIMDQFGNDVVLFQEVIEPSILSIEMEAVDLNGFNLSCDGGSDGTAIAAPSGGVPPYSYIWQNGDTQPTSSNLMAGDYNISVTDAVGCEEVAIINLTEPTPIDLNVQFIDSNCDGIETGVIMLDYVSGGTPSYSYALNNGSFSGNTAYNNLAPGNYEFIAMDANGCLESITGTTETPDIPIIDLGDDLIVQLGCDILIPAVGTHIVNVQWTGGETLDCDTCLTPFAKPLDNSFYQVVVTSADDCTATDEININVDKVRNVYFPNAFSPNDDGINDIFFIGTGKAVDKINSLQVFDRWGELIYDATDLPANDPLAGWDGIFKNKKMNPGIFLWTAEVAFIDGEVERYGGDVVLIK